MAAESKESSPHATHDAAPASTGLLSARDALLEGDSALALHFLTTGGVADERDSDGRSLLHWASSTGHVDAVEACLRAGAAIDAVDEAGWTALHCAAASQKPAVVGALQAAGASASVQNAKGQTPLHLAKGHAGVLASLADAVEDVDVPDHLGMTALHRAVLSGSTEGVSLLIAQGATVNAKTAAGDTPVHLAASLGPAAAGMVGLLKRNGASGRHKNRDGVTGDAEVSAAARMASKLAEGQGLHR